MSGTYYSFDATTTLDDSALFLVRNLDTNKNISFSSFKSLLFAGPSITGNLNFTGTGNRITGDFSNATVASRVALQTSTANSSTAITALPNGTNAVSRFDSYNSSDPTNAGFTSIFTNAAGSRLAAGASGTGTGLPLTFYTVTTGTTGAERMRILTGTAGNILMGATTETAGAEKLQVTGAISASGAVLVGGNLDFTGTGNRITGDFSNSTISSSVHIQTNVTNGGTFPSILPNGTGVNAGITARNSSDADNSSTISLQISNILASITGSISGTGTQLPLGLRIGSTTHQLISTNGNIILKTAAEQANDDGVNKFQVIGGIKTDQYKLSALNTAPSSATDTGTLGEIRVTSTHIYVCTASNTWVRAALSTW